MTTGTDFGTMVISLDFELLWGFLDVKNSADYEPSILGGREAIPHILELFEKYQIHATWGIVGMMTYNNINECMNDLPEIQPAYEDPLLSSYTHLNKLYDKDKDLLFAGNLIKQISDCPFQEIGSHTYSHYYCLESGQSEDAFEQDLEKSVEVMSPYTNCLKSIILPRNQYNPANNDALKKYGLINYRGNEDTWFNKANNGTKKNSLPRKCARFLDNYLNICGHHCYSYSEIKNEEGLNNIRSSRFLRPYSSTFQILEPLRLLRIKGQMRWAARKNMVFHLWWHPHNFGKSLQENLRILEKLLQYYHQLRTRYHMQSMSMGELGDLIP